jgi:hypothetical protein
MTELQILRYVDKSGGSANWVEMLNKCPNNLEATQKLLKQMAKSRLISVSDVPSTTITILEAGRARLDKLDRHSKEAISNWVRWAITTIIALAAFIKSFWF